jgi:hypothetical protein
VRAEAVVVAAAERQVPVGTAVQVQAKWLAEDGAPDAVAI